MSTIVPIIKVETNKSVCVGNSTYNKIQVQANVTRRDVYIPTEQRDKRLLQ